MLRSPTQGGHDIEASDKPNKGFKAGFRPNVKHATDTTGYVEQELKESAHLRLTLEMEEHLVQEEHLAKFVQGLEIKR